MSNNIYNDAYRQISGNINRFNQYTENFDNIFTNNSKKNAFEENNLYYISTYVNIDTSLLNRITTAQCEFSEKLDKDPFEFTTHNQKKIKIYHNCHELVINDKIQISGINTIKRSLKIKVDNIYYLELKEGSRFMKIKLPEILSEDDEDIFKEVRLNFANCNKNEILQYEQDLYIKISGYIVPNNKIGNIHVNYINNKHKIKFLCPDNIWKCDELYEYNSFYIDLTKIFNGNYNPGICTIDIIFYYISGIPINKLNASYPLTIDSQQGSHQIIDINKTYYCINLFREPKLRKGDKIMRFGKNNICINKIKTLEYGLSNTNNYIYKLEQTINNIVFAKLVNTQFPNTIGNVTNNNKLYWECRNDDKISCLEIPIGTYTHCSLKQEIEKKSNLKIDINQETNITSIRMIKNIILKKPFINIDPEINKFDAHFNLTIYCQDHDFLINDKIIIFNSISYMGIPENILNAEHKIIKILDQNKFVIKLENFNLLKCQENNCGGNIVNITFYETFRLRLDFNCNLGQLLGFKDIGLSTSITEYKNIITNLDKYIYEDKINNSVIDFNPNKYFIMTLEKFNNINNYGKIKKFFSKILIENNIFLNNTFVPILVYFPEPIIELNELQIAFYTPDGIPYDFKNQNHSFIIEFISLAQKPKNTNTISTLGLIN
jgi:hypothetical protein